MEHFPTSEEVIFPEFELQPYEQEVQPAASVPNVNYFPGGQYAVPKYVPMAYSTANYASMMVRTPSAASMPSMASTVSPELLTPPAMHTSQVHDQQRPAAVQGHHSCPNMDDWQDEAALMSLCEHTNRKGKHGESCEDVGVEATAACIKEWRNGNCTAAKAKFHRQASKNLNQKTQRAIRQEKKQAARRNR